MTLAAIDGATRSAGDSIPAATPKETVPPAAPAVAPAPASRWQPFRIPEVGFDLEIHERELIEQALERTKQNKTAAAKMLGLSRATLRYRLDKYNVAKNEKDDDE